MKKINMVFLSLMAVIFSMTGTAVKAENQFITIGTAGVTGVYYPTGSNICKLLHASKGHNIRCSVEATGGSAFNINAIRAGELDFGIAQSDAQYNAYHGLTDKFSQNGPFKDLRALFSVHSEAFNVVARADAGVKTFDDLAGKRVNIGDPGSGTRATMEVFLKSKGWTEDKFGLTSELKYAELSSALCDGNIDAYAYIAGHPNGNFKEATTTCGAVFVPVTGEVVDGLIKEYAYYAKATVPGGMYRDNPEDINTFGMKATIVASTQMSDEVAYQIVKAVFENLDTFKRLHPAYSTLKKENMVKDGLSVPLHPGAVKYFKEAGLL